MNWDAVTAIVAILALVVAVVGGFIAWKTYESTVDTAQKQLRGYIGIESIDLEIPSKHNKNYAPRTKSSGAVATDFIALKIKNYGATPANKLKVWSSWDFTPFPKDLPPNYEFSDAKEDLPNNLKSVVSEFSVYPGQDVISRIAINDITPFLDAGEKKRLAFVFGHIDYEDIYGRKHQTKYCYMYQPFGVVNQDFVPYDRNNESD